MIFSFAHAFSEFFSKIGVVPARQKSTDHKFCCKFRKQIARTSERVSERDSENPLKTSEKETLSEAGFPLRGSQACCPYSCCPL